MMSLGFARRTFVPASIAALAAFFQFGCGSDLADQPLFKDQLKLVQRMDEDTKAIHRQVEDMGVTIAELQKQVREARISPAGDDPRITQLETKLSEVERTLISLQGAKVAGLAKAAKRAPEPAAAAPADPAIEAMAALAEKASSGSAVAEAKPKEHAQKPATEIADAAPAEKQARVAPVSKAPASKPQTVLTAGFYHLVQAGETADSLAKRYGIKTKSLIDANNGRLASNRPLRAGQQIFVPKTK